MGGCSHSVTMVEGSIARCLSGATVMTGLKATWTSLPSSKTTVCCGSRVIPMSGDQIRLALAVCFGSASAVAAILMVGLAGSAGGVLYSPLEFKSPCQATGAEAVNRTGWDAVTVASGGLMRSSAGLQLGQTASHCQRRMASRMAAQTTQ